MLLLTSTSDLITVVTASTGSVKVHVSWVDNLSGAITPGRTNTAFITTATTTTVVASPAASTQRNVKMLSVRNDHASTSNAVIINHTDGTTVEPIWEGTLLAQEQVVLDQNGKWTNFDANGIVKSSTGITATRAYFAPAQAISATRVYMTNTNISVPLLAAGNILKWQLALTKTAAGVVAPILELLVGTNGTTADTARFVTATTAWTQAMLAQSAAVDRAILDVECVCVGGGATGSLYAQFRLGHMLAATGFSVAGTQYQGGVTGSIDLSAANIQLGLVVTAGTSAAWTLDAVRTEFLSA